MIRATVNYEVTAPVITSPKDGSFTNKDSVTVEGTSAPTTTVHLFNGDEKAGTADTAEDGTFSLDVSLHEGENVLTAKAATEQGMTGPSDAITIMLDQVKPELSITSPEHDMKTNREAITVEGTVMDENLAWVKVNGEKASVSDGEFSHRILWMKVKMSSRLLRKIKQGTKRKTCNSLREIWGH